MKVIFQNCSCDRSPQTLVCKNEDSEDDGITNKQKKSTPDLRSDYDKGTILDTFW
jgi:hypothetical protein